MLLSLVATVVISPLVFCPLKMLDGYVLPQIGVAAIGISLTAIFFICGGVFPLNLSSILACMYLVYLFCSSSWSTVPHNSLRDIPLVFACLSAFVISSVVFHNSIISMVVVSLGVFFVAMFTSLYAIAQRFGIDPLFPERIISDQNVKASFATRPHEIPWFYDKDFVDLRPISTLGNTNFAAGYFGATLPFLLYLCAEVSPWFILSVIVLLLAIYMTKSRGGALGICVSTVVLLILISQRGWVFDALFFLFGDLPSGINMLLGAFVITAGVHLLILARKYKPFSSLSDPMNKVNTMLDIEDTSREHFTAHLRYRLRYWKAGLELFLRRPLQGYGLRTYRKEVYDSQARLHQKDGKFLGPQYVTPQPREVHNDYIENFVEGGAIGGLLFLSIVGVVFYHGFVFLRHTEAKEALVMICLLSGALAVMTHAAFFFPFRLGSSAITFWVCLAMIEALSGGVQVFTIDIHFLAVILAAGALAAMLWEGVIKPNAGNYYFSKYNFSKFPENKEVALVKAITLAPKESIYRTHALINYLQLFPYEGDRQAEILRQHYDGMTPAWVMEYNCGVAKLYRKQVEDAFPFFTKTLYYNPLFDAVRPQLEIFEPLVPLPRRGQLIMKKMTDEGINAIRHYQSEIKGIQTAVQSMELAMGNVILNEKLKMNVPIQWAFDLEQGTFLTVDEVAQGGYRIIEFGPTKIPLAMKQAPVLNEQAQPKPGPVGIVK